VEINKDRWYALCDRHVDVSNGHGGVIQAHKDGERCDFVSRHGRCKGVATWEFFTGKELN